MQLRDIKTLVFLVLGLLFLPHFANAEVLYSQSLTSVATTTIVDISPNLYLYGEKFQVTSPGSHQVGGTGTFHFYLSCAADSPTYPCSITADIFRVATTTGTEITQISSTNLTVYSTSTFWTLGASTTPSLGNGNEGGKMNFGNYYRVRFQSTSGSPYKITSYQDALGNLYTTIIDSGGGDIPGQTGVGTRILEPIPSWNAVVATSTAVSVGARTFIDINDFVDTGGLEGDWYLRINYQRTAGQFALSLEPNYKTVDIPIPANGYGTHIFSATTTFSTVGEYTLRSELRNSTLTGSLLRLISFGFWDTNTIAATTTTFFVGNQTQYDQYVANKEANYFNFFDTATTTAQDTSLLDCLTFSIPHCMSYLFYPSEQVLIQYSALGDNLSMKPPFGYFTVTGRIISNASTSATSTNAYFAFVSNSLGTLIAGLAIIIQLAMVFWLFNRIRKWEWQT